MVKIKGRFAAKKLHGTKQSRAGQTDPVAKHQVTKVFWATFFQKSRDFFA